MCQEDLIVLRGRLRGRIVAFAALVALTPILAACGEDEPSQTAAPAETGASTTKADTTTSSEPGVEPEADKSAEPVDDEAAIVASLEAVLAQDDAKNACGEAVTERFLRRAYGDASGCEAALSGAKPASDARVTQVVITPGSVAQALARPQGGIYNGQKLRAELILDEDTWKLDSLRSNVPVGP